MSDIVRLQIFFNILMYTVLFKCIVKILGHGTECVNF